MSKIQIDGTALVIAVVVAAVGFMLLPGPFFWIGSIAGLVAAIVLLSFDAEGARSLFESLGFSAVVGLCLTLASGAPLLLWFVHNGQSRSFDGPIGSEWMPIIWTGLTILFWIIDRTRMSGRVQYAPEVRPGAQPFSFAAAPAAVPPPAPPTTAAAPPRAIFTQPSFGQAAPESARPAPVPEPVIVSEPPRPDPATAVQPTPAPHAAPIPAGKETTIYVTLVGEGLNVLRAVGAEHLGRDFYKIIEPMPDGEVWQFAPGQVVRCKKKNLSSGKAMVAIEEAPRAR